MSQEEIEKLEGKIAQPEIQEKLIDEINEENQKSPIIKFLVIGFGILLLVAFAVTWLFTSATEDTKNDTLVFLSNFFDKDLLKYLFVGLIAQMVDGALGMAYGATATAFLASIGVGAAQSSASIHISEVFTTGASGISHFKLGNVNKKLFYNLVVPGVIGAILGASVLCILEKGDLLTEDQIKTYLRPLTTVYTLILGTLILRKALLKVIPKKKIKRIAPLAIFGAFMDSIGGGGWGPIVTSTLLSSGRSIKYTIGSVNTAEFFIALASSITFTLFVGIETGLWKVIFGLIVGGVFAAPFAAILVNKIKRRPLMLFVGCFIIFLSLNTFAKIIYKVDLITMLAKSVVSLFN
ncbi:MAG TPA: sulfite exporter TauE/SafE family protein [Cytophagales bacterium]|nr:sulfite exporter TauE/SafE family protein [Cytophagales bacterium]